MIIHCDDCKDGSQICDVSQGLFSRLLENLAARIKWAASLSLFTNVSSLPEKKSLQSIRMQILSYLCNGKDHHHSYLSSYAYLFGRSERIAITMLASCSCAWAKHLC
jgi:hypothetical protein